MMKKIFAAAMAAQLVLPLCPVANAQADIQIGDYVRLGSYRGNPILWRCIDIDEYGPLMLSDKVLTVKQYDTSGQHTTDDDYNSRQKNGSNRWSDSNIRSWLNSDKPAGEVEWLCGNPPSSYKSEAGFLEGFGEAEKIAMKAVSHKSILDINTDVEFAEGGGYLDYDQSKEYWASILREKMYDNYDNLYYETVTDKVTLLDLWQWHKFAYSGMTYEGYIGYESAAIAQSAINELTMSTLPPYPSYKHDFIFLRTPAFVGEKGVNSMGTKVMTGYNFKSASDTWVDIKNGIRPAFYLDTENTVFAGGDGGRVTPYVIEGAADTAPEQYRAVPTEQKIYIDGNEVQLTAYNIDGNNYFRLRDLAEIMKSSGVPFNVGYRADADMVYMVKNEEYTGGYEDIPEYKGEAAAVDSRQFFANKYYTDKTEEGYSFGNAIIRAYNIGGYNYCRLRDIGMNLFFTVDYDKEANSILVKTKE